MRAIYTSLTSKIEDRLKIDVHYFLHGGFWLSISQVATILLGLLTTALFAHFLTEAEFGLYKYLIGISVILSSFSLTGIGQSILQAAAKGYPGFYRETLRVNFIYSLGITLAGIAGAGYYWYNENNILAIGCLLVALLQPFISSLQNIPSLLQGSKRFKENTYLQIGRMLGTTLISVAVLFLTKSVLVLFFFYLFANLFVLVASNFLYTPQKQKVPGNIFNQYISYAKHTSFRNIISNIAQRADAVIVFTQLGAVELAVYSIALVIPEQIKGSFKNITLLLLPKYLSHINIGILNKSISKRSIQAFIILFTVTITYILFSPFVYMILFPKYEEAVFYSQLIALSFPTFTLMIPTVALQAKLAETELYKITMIGSIFQITSLLVLVFFFGLIGAILAKVFYRFFTMILTFFYFKKLSS